MPESNSNDATPQAGSPSPARIEANRRNGSQSKGAKTETGKVWAKGNALKYGLSSSQVVIERIDGECAQERFASLHRSLRKHFAPEDPVSEFRVQRVAANLWRLDRHDRAEAAMLDEASLRAAQDDLLLRLRLPGISNEDIPGTAAATEPHSHRLRILIDRLAELEEEVQRDGGLSAESLSDVMKLFGTSDPFALNSAVLCVTVNAADQGSNWRPDALPSETVASLIEQARRLISDRRQQLSELQPELEHLEQMQRAAHLTALCIPSPANVERLWRSRAAINKELEQDLAYLNDRLQQGKKNLAVSAPRGKLSEATGLE
jgi:hypothetical protein